MQVKDLKPAGYNPRKISAKQLAALKKSLKEFGDLSGIVVNVRTGNMVGGHQRVKALDPEWRIHKSGRKDNTGTVATGHVETPFGNLIYREVDWDEIKEKAANLAANKHGGEWDLPKLDIVLGELKEFEFDMELTGFEFDPPGDVPADISGIENNYAAQYGVIVMCENESHQEEVYNFLAEHGYNCKVVNT